MKRKSIYIAIIIIIISCFLSPTMSNAYEIDHYSENVAPMSKNLKGKDDYNKILSDINRIRNNLYAININTITGKNNALRLNKEINFHMSEFKNIQMQLNELKRQYKDSKSDVLFIEQVNLTISNYKISLEEQLNLIELLVADEREANSLFYSEHLGHIYYYVALGDQIMTYINSYYRVELS